MCVCVSVILEQRFSIFFIDNSEIFFFLLSSWRFDSNKKKIGIIFHSIEHTHTLGEKVSESWNFFFSFFFGCLQYDFGCWFLCYWIIIIMVFIRFYRFDWLSLFCVRLRMIHPSLPLSTNCVCVVSDIQVFLWWIFFRFVCFWPFRNRILFFHKHFQLISIHSPSLGLSLSLIRIHSFIVDSQHYHQRKKCLTMKPAKKITIKWWLL